MHEPGGNLFRWKNPHLTTLKLHAFALFQWDFPVSVLRLRTVQFEFTWACVCVTCIWLPIVTILPTIPQSFYSSHFQPLLCPCARMNARWGKPTSTCESILFQWTISLKCLSVVTFKQIDDDDDGNDDDDYADALHMPYIYKYELIRCALFGAFARFHFVLFIRKGVKCHAYHLCSQIVE